MFKKLLEKPLNNSEIEKEFQHKWDKFVVCVILPAVFIIGVVLLFKD